MICFCWYGFPHYAARCVGAVVRATDENVVVVATRPSVPIGGMEHLAGCRVVWIAGNEPRALAEIVGEVPRLVFVSGWSIPAFVRYRDETRSAGGRVVAMPDNNFCLKNTKEVARETLKAVRFRFLLRNKYDGFFVPGKSSLKLMRFYGVRPEKIRMGVYAADAQLFGPGAPLSQRSRTILYVGQFIDRKNVRALCRAFIAAGGADAGWKLELYGAGTLEGELRVLAATSRSIVVNHFLQPEALAEKYRAARVLCLPSREECWGLVVHEAALSGCMLLLSDRVGAREDFEGRGNVFAFDPYDERAMAEAFRKLFALGEDEFDAAGAESVRKGREGASMGQFVASVLGFGAENSGRVESCQ